MFPTLCKHIWSNDSFGLVIFRHEATFGLSTISVCRSNLVQFNFVKRHNTSIWPSLVFRHFCQMTLSTVSNKDQNISFSLMKFHLKSFGQIKSVQRQLVKGHLVKIKNYTVTILSDLDTIFI